MGQIVNGFTGFSGKSSNFQYSRDHRETPTPDASPFDDHALDSLGVQDKRWAWVEIDTSAIRYNTMEAKRFMQPGCKLMAVVKADGYGHGAIPCAKASLSAGADYLGVATVEEGIQLREADIAAPILILAQPPLASIPLLLAHNIMPSVYEPDFAISYGEMADAHGMMAPYHLAINSGMNRIGVRAEEAVEFLRQVSFHRALDLKGTFTHFATADCAETLDFQVQAKRFIEAINEIRAIGIDPGIVHAANSAAIFRYRDVHFDMVRLGISLYGFHPCNETRTMVQLRPAMSVHARITNVMQVPMSEGVSYGMNYRSPGSVKICTVPLGYADGLRRGLSGKTDFILAGQRVHQVGNICMDQCMFEVDMRSYGMRERLNPQVGDEVIIVGRQENSVVTIDDMANILGSIQHEVAIGFSHRMQRVYR